MGAPYRKFNVGRVKEAVKEAASTAKSPATANTSILRDEEETLSDGNLSDSLEDVEEFPENSNRKTEKVLEQLSKKPNPADIYVSDNVMALLDEPDEDGSEHESAVNKNGDAVNMDSVNLIKKQKFINMVILSNTCFDSSCRLTTPRTLEGCQDQDPKRKMMITMTMENRHVLCSLISFFIYLLLSLTSQPYSRTHEYNVNLFVRT